MNLLGEGCRIFSLRIIFQGSLVFIWDERKIAGYINIFMQKKFLCYLSQSYFYNNNVEYTFQINVFFYHKSGSLLLFITIYFSPL